MSQSKKSNCVEVIFFERFSLFKVCVITEKQKEPELCIIYKRKCLKAISSKKTKNKTTKSF